MKLSQVTSNGSPKINSPAICVCVNTAGKFNKLLNIALPFCDEEVVMLVVVPEAKVAFPCCVVMNAAEVDDEDDLILAGETEMPKLDVIDPDAKSNFCAATDTLKLAVRVAPVKSVVPMADTENDEDSSSDSSKK